MSNFTSVERLSCCLALVTTYMLVNIMFYGVDAGPGDQRLDIGLYTISLSELVIGNLKILHKRFRRRCCIFSLSGFQATLLIWPTTIVIVMLFKMIEKRKEPRVRHEHLTFDITRVRSRSN